MKKLLALLLVLLLVAPMSACQKSAPAPSGASGPAPASEGAKPEESKDDSEPKDIYFISLMTGGAAWTIAERAFYEACDELGWNGYYLAPVDRNNQTEMSTLLESAITADADAIIGVFLSADAFGPALQRAKEKGIVTASVNTKLSEEFVDFQIGTNQVQQGKIFAKSVIDLAEGGEYNVVYMNNDASETFNMMFNSIKEEFDKHDNINLVDFLFDAGSAVTAAEVIADYKKANPEVNAVICGNSSAATIGVASYIEEQGVQDDWIVIGVDHSADILNYVKAGVLDGTVAQNFYAMGHDSVMLIRDIIEGGTRPAFENDTGCSLILPEQVDEFAAKMQIDLG